MRSDDRSAVRPRTFTETARRAQILGCAIDALAELGYARTSFAQVAERAGISKSVISYHFAGKDELLEQVVAHVHALGADYIGPRVRAEDTAAGMLSAYLRANVEFLRDHPAAIAAVGEIAAGVRTRDGARRFPAGPGGIEQTLKPLQTIFVQGQESGEFAAFDTRVMAWSVRSLIDSLPRWQALDPEFDFAVCIEELTALVERATVANRP